MSFGTPFPASGRSEISLLEQSMREKDDIIQAQYAELVELRRQHELALGAITFWKAKAGSGHTITRVRLPADAVKTVNAP